MDWKGKVCLITGGSSGIGRTTAKKFAERGATVIAVARREDRLASLVDELGGPPHSYVVCDVGDLEQVRAMAKTVAQRSDHIDILMNGAGIPSRGPLNKTTPEEAGHVIRVNLLGAIWCTLELMSLLDKAPRTDRTPMIVNLASMGGRIAVPGASVYTATKFGLVGFTEAIWGEMREKGIRTLVLNPGFVETEGFPMDHLTGSSVTRWTVMGPERVADALCEGIERGRAEVVVQRWWYAVYVLGVVTGPLRRLVADLTRKLVVRRIDR